MIKKFLVMGAALIVCFGMFTACEDEFATDQVSVSIKTEYKDKFLAEEFTAEDFNWENFERIEYGTWNSTIEPEIGFLTVYLKRHGKKRVEDAIEHIYKLEFVNGVGTVGGKLEMY
jgi:hypothetical protein